MFLQAVARSAHIPEKESTSLNMKLAWAKVLYYHTWASCLLQVPLYQGSKENPTAAPRLDMRRAGGAADTAELEAGLSSDLDQFRYQHLTCDPPSREKTPQESLAPLIRLLRQLFFQSYIPHPRSRTQKIHSPE